MEKQTVEFVLDRFYLNDPETYLVRGIFPAGTTARAFLDREELKSELRVRESESIADRVQNIEAKGCIRADILVKCPEEIRKEQVLQIRTELMGRTLRSFTISGKELLAKRGRPQYHLDEVVVDQKFHFFSVSGWAASTVPVTIRLYDQNKQPVPCTIRTMDRADVRKLFEECEVAPECGFYLELHEIPAGRYLYLVMTGEGGKKSVRKIGLVRSEILLEKTEKYRKKSINYLKANGLAALAAKGVQTVMKLQNRPITYAEWQKKHRTGSLELERQKKESFAGNPKVSILVTSGRTTPDYTAQLIKSVKKQTYSNWELLFAGAEDANVIRTISKACDEDTRIRMMEFRADDGFAKTLGAVLQEAEGDILAYVSPDAMLSPDTLYECVKAFDQNPEAGMLYTDEDQVAHNGKNCQHHHFKSDLNIDLLCSTNYIGDFFCVKRGLMERVEIPEELCVGAEKYDLLFRYVEEAQQVYHIPKVLYHARSYSELSEKWDEDTRSWEMGRQAVEAHYNRIGVKAEVSLAETRGTYHTTFLRDRDPLISILIPNKDHTDDLERCIASVEAKTAYSNYEYIIIENNSVEEETFRYYKELEERNPKAHVVYWDGPFNYSAINNYGASFAKGEYFILLNNDTEVINGAWMEELLGYCMRSDVGIVGARLYYDDDTIQHAGVIMGFGEIAGHAFVQQPAGNPGYHNRIVCAQDYTAVTAACLMVKRSVFEEVEGLSTVLAVAFNDVDFCLKVRKAGYLVVYNPYVELYHYESKSRGLEDTPEKKARFAKEIDTLKSRWPEVFTHSDPYYNPNLTLVRQDFSL